MQEQPFPDWWIRQANERKKLLQDSVAGIRAHVDLLHDIEGLLVFGSFARGEIGPESDLDLIAVMQTDEPFAFRGLQLRKKLMRLLKVPFDLIVYTPEEFARYSIDRDFVAQARAEGIWIDAAASA